MNFYVVLNDTNSVHLLKSLLSQMGQNLSENRFCMTEETKGTKSQKCINIGKTKTDLRQYDENQEHKVKGNK